MLDLVAFFRGFCYALWILLCLPDGLVRRAKYDDLVLVFGDMTM